MPLETQTFDDVNAGMNLAKATHELSDNEARYLQDALLDLPGMIKRRGPVQATPGFPTFTEKGCGITGTLDPVGNYRLALLTGDNSNGYFRMLNASYSAYETFTWTGALPASPPSNPYRIVDTKPALTGGVWIGTSSQYNAAGPIQNLALWRGGINDNYSTGTITLTRGSTTVTGAGTSWVSEVTPGMFLFATVVDSANTGQFNSTYIGIVKTVDSNTQITLGAVSPYTTAGGAYTLQSIRGFQYRINKGRITTVTSSTTVTGATTKFLSQKVDDIVLTTTGTLTSGSAVVTGIASTTLLKRGMRIGANGVPANTYIASVDSSTQITMNNNATANGAASMNFRHMWNLYRASDLAWIGRLGTSGNSTAGSVSTEISLTLAANAAIATSNERFLLINSTGDWSINTATNTDKVGFLTATYAQRQWFANNGNRSELNSRLWYSDPADPEAVDLTEYDGDFINLASSIGTDTPIKALVPAYNTLVVIKENETFGITGSTPTTFDVKKIEDDGTMSGMSAQAYGGGVIWAGRDGIHYFDGLTSRNMTADKLGEYYKNALRSFNPTQYRMWSMMARDHYVLFIESFSPNTAVIKGTVSVTPTATAIVINMVTQSVGLWTNINLRGFVETPADTGKQVLYIVNSNTRTYVCNGFALFDTYGPDEVLCDLGSSAGKYNYGITDPTTYSTFAGVGDTKYASSITTDQLGAIEAIHVYIQGAGGGAGTSAAKAILYADSAGAPGALLGESAEVTLNQSATTGSYYQFSFATPIEVVAGTYWIGIHLATSGIVNLYRGTTVSAIQSNADVYAGGAANPFGAATGSNGKLAAYARVLSIGPDFYWEAKKYTEGDAMWKKLFKHLALTYMTQGDALRLDTVLGMNNIGRTSTTQFASTTLTWAQLSSIAGTWEALSQLYPTWDELALSVFRPKKIKFTKRSQMMSFRIYQDSPAVTRVQIGPYQIGFKRQRKGRV